MVSKKPAIIIDDQYQLWIGNLTDSHLDLQPGELFGFGRGSFTQKIVSYYTSIIGSGQKTYKNNVSQMFRKEVVTPH